MNLRVTSHLERLRNWTFAAIGTVFVGIGVLGIFVPGLPTTIFLLIAAFFYTRSCPRLRQWLFAHRYLGPYLTQIVDHRAMPYHAKVKAIIMLWMSLGLSAALTVAYTALWPAWLVIFLVVGAGVSWLIGCYVRTSSGDLDRASASGSPTM